MNKLPGLMSLLMLAVVVLTSYTSRVVTVDDAYAEDEELAVAMSLYDSIVAMDVLWEDAYNNCKLDVMEELISEDLEFYHDQGGLMTSKQKLNEALKNNICVHGKVELCTCTYSKVPSH